MVKGLCARAAETLAKNFYVGDALKSIPTEKDAIELVQALKGIRTKGGFNLTKFVNNMVHPQRS